MSWTDHARPGVQVAPSPFESDRFGLSVSRAVVGTATAEETSAALDSCPDDLVVVRFDASRRDLADALSRTGRRVLPAGTLVYWERPAAAGALASGSDELVVVRARDLGDRAVAVLDDVVGDSFAAYGNHYSVNPLLDPAKALAGYQEWARRSLDDPTHEVALLLDGAEPVGGATVEVTGEHVEILLAGLVSRAQGRGAYRALLAWSVAECEVRGLSRVVISTQADNVRVQRAWARAGFVPFAAVETVHLVRGAGSRD